ncbi:MAG: hypothetical protein F6J93_26405 [Oscillatoria sp. SIO1A7]|nr:hypothetical protein [Oscillatoria sp. SIO1A7]
MLCVVIAQLGDAPSIPFGIGNIILAQLNLLYNTGMGTLFDCARGDGHWAKVKVEG